MFLLWKWARAWGKAKGLRREVAHDQVIIFSMFGCSKPCNCIFVDQILNNNIDDRSWPGVPARCMLPSGKSTADGGRPLVIEHYRSPGMAFGRSKYLSVLDSPIITISHEFYGAQRAPLWQRIWLSSHAIPPIHLHTWGPQFTYVLWNWMAGIVRDKRKNNCKIVPDRELQVIRKIHYRSTSCTMIR